MKMNIYIHFHLQDIFSLSLANNSLQYPNIMITIREIHVDTRMEFIKYIYTYMYICNETEYVYSF